MVSDDVQDLKAITDILEAKEEVVHNPFSAIPNNVLKEAYKVLETHIEES